MKKAHRKIHTATWFLLVPIAAAMIWFAIEGRSTVPTEETFPLVEKQETFK